VPDLLDGGFLTGGNASTSYAGWRDGSFYVPVSLLKTGINTVQFSDEDDAALILGGASPSDTGLGPPLAIKALVLQLNYLPVRRRQACLNRNLPQPPPTRSRRRSLPQPHLKPPRHEYPAFYRHVIKEPPAAALR
jgi:hypothetical protein